MRPEARPALARRTRKRWVQAETGRHKTEQAPNIKHQIANKLQARSTKQVLPFEILNLDII
jgi:hypothetical protein